ncbi:hypothetical protein D3C80_2096560 [compost metagenome]
MNAQQVVGARMEESRVDVAGLFDVLLGQDRGAGSHSANDRQGGIVGLGFEAWNANASGSTRGHLDGTFAG